MSITAEKKALRRQLLDRLEGMPQAEREESDRILFRRFLDLSQIQACQNLFLFLGVPGREPDTRRLLERIWEQGKQAALPRMLGQHQMEFRLYQPGLPLVQTRFGIWEPGEECPVVSKDWGQVVLVPAVAYDLAGYRLGFGGGFYDRWLPGYSGFRVGLCREAVFQEALPREAHDCQVDLVLTEKKKRDITPALSKSENNISRFSTEYQS